MRLVIADFETFWSQTHSLTKMSPIEYVMHPETEIISLAIKYGDEQTQVIFGEDLIRDHLEAQDWSDVMLVAHNMSAFDAMIFAWRFGVKPKAWGCTLAMARPIHSKTTGNSLAKLVAHYGLGEKDNTALLNTKGKHLKDFNQEEIWAMREYNCDDTDQCYALFNILIKHYNAAELWQIDATIRMLVEPKFVLNKRVLDGALSGSRVQKQQALEAMGRILYGDTYGDVEDVEEGVRSMLASAPQFAQLLTSLGVDVPMKASPSDPTKQIPALSKTDQEFLDLQEHDDPVVALAASTRLDVKSTLLQTRLESFIATGKVLRGKLPIPIHYCGADTTGRWCLTPDHEVLTKNGWVRLDQWCGESIMQWCADSGVMQWCETTRVASFPTEEKLVQFSSDYHRAVYTQEHRIPCKMHGGTKYESVTAGKLATLKRRAMAVSGVVRGNPVFVPECNIRLIVAMHADGYNVQDDKNNMVRFRFTKARKVKRVEELLFLAGIPYTKHTYPSEPSVKVIIIKGRDAPDWLRTAKVLPDWFYLLDSRQCEFVLEELQHWDGGSTGPESFEWCGADEDAATKYATIAHLCGHRAKVTLRERAAEGWTPSYRISFCPQTTYHVRGEHATRIDYKGPVYCPTVDSGFFLCRRQNTIFVTGNSGFIYNPQNLPSIDPSKPKLADALRKSMMAPPGYKVVVADLSGIELRVNHFLWKVPSSMALYKASPDKADLYKDFAAKLYEITEAEVIKTQRQVGKVAHLGLGFGSGAATFQKVAKLMGGVDLTLKEAEQITYRWRDEYEEIVRGWKACEAALPYVLAGDKVYEVDPWGLVTTEKGALVLPSGRRIRYPALSVEKVGKYKEWEYGVGRHRTKIYSGKIDENCLAEGTQVLTDSGWKSIETVGLLDKVHDGVEFVSHDGIVFKSVQSCVMVDGVYMTPDHEVLTDEGWQEASQVQRPYWLCIRGVDSAAPGIFDGALVEVAVFVPMRSANREVRLGHNQGNKTRRDSQLRVFAREPDICEEPHAWNEQAPGVCCLPKYVGPVQQPEPQGVEKLRGAWNHCVQSLATIFRELLGRHAGWLRFWGGLGSGGQQRGLLSGELSLGGSAYQLDEQANDYTDRGRPSTKQADGDWQKHAIQPHPERLADRQVNNEAITSKPVYDILNCGPRSRFVVNGDTAPFIVHNCVQALARDIIADNAYTVFKELKLRPSLMVHDELVYVVPEDQAQHVLDTVQRIMRTPPVWWPELITWSEGDIAQSYGEAK